MGTVTVWLKSPPRCGYIVNGLVKTLWSWLKDCVMLTEKWIALSLSHDEPPPSWPPPAVNSVALSLERLSLFYPKTSHSPIRTQTHSLMAASHRVRWGLFGMWTGGAGDWSTTVEDPLHLLSHIRHICFTDVLVWSNAWKVNLQTGISAKKQKNLNTLSSVYQMYFFMFWKRSERHLLCFIKTDTTVTETTKEWHHQLPGIRCSLCVCLHVTKHECYIVVPPLDAIMSSTLVIRQPKPVMEARESDEWDSGICDCCHDVPECKCLCLSDCLILTPVKV